MTVSITADGRDGFALAKEAGASGPVAAVVGGKVRDLAHVPASGETVEILTQADEAGREVVRHSTAHVLAQAVLRLYPGARYAIGPPIDDGFYYDFEVADPFTPEDLDRIESEMRAIVKANQRFERAEISSEEGVATFVDQPYKLEIIRGVAEGVDALEQQGAGGEVLSLYRNVDPSGHTAFVDLCRGPHVPGTGRIKAFKLLRSAGAYWRGDETKPMLQRIYGTAWESKDALAAYLHRLEEAERRDHRRIGRELELYSWEEEVGPGIALWHPKGAIVRQALEGLSRDLHLKRGYKPVYTPHIGKAKLWESSGHLDHFQDNMFPRMEYEGGDYFAKPMNCPFHVLIYRSKTRSYRELPYRLSELGTVYRNERSGAVHGLLRSRGFTQDDSHIFCTPDQVVDELVEVVDFLRELYAAVGMGPDAVRFSTKPDNAIGTQEQWDLAESAIEQALQKSGLDFRVDEGDGAFYGPKIDIDVRDAIGRYWQLCTIQVDFQLPDRFGLQYIDDEGHRRRPVMIHRALFGSIERFFGVLVEHFAGAFPTWLSPVQAALIPIADRHASYAYAAARKLSERGLRVEVDDSSDTMGAKIRRRQLEKVPYMLIVGDDEQAAETVSVRRRSGKETRGVSVGDFARDLELEVSERRVEPSI
ncbi:MAG: threonine--tRNA ligase [Actinobacteria bacterium]|nr:threonine--tRNA ligase [Actinomycetota bacterium]